jgi:hypothetical protein
LRVEQRNIIWHTGNVNFEREECQILGGEKEKGT